MIMIEPKTNILKSTLEKITIERYDQITHDDRAFGVIVKHDNKEITIFEVTEVDSEEIRDTISKNIQSGIHDILNWLKAITLSDTGKTF